MLLENLNEISTERSQAHMRLALCSTAAERLADAQAVPAGGAPPHLIVNTEHLLALSVFQVKVWVEVDQNPLVRSWSCNHPCAFLRRVVRHRITGWSEVIRTSDSDIVPTFVWKKRIENFHSCCKSAHLYTPCCVLDDCPQYGTSWTRFIRKILLINQLLNPSFTCWFTNQQCTTVYNSVNTLTVIRKWKQF